MAETENTPTPAKKTTPRRKTSGPPAAAEGTPAADMENAIEAIAPRIAKRDQKVYYKDESTGSVFDRVYTQQKLGFFTKVEFTAIVGKAIDSVLEKNSESSGGINELLSEGTTSMESFLRIIMQVAAATPELLTELYMVALAVPRHERPIVEDIWQLPHDEETGAGGLSDDDGFTILKLIFEQNGQAIRELFLEKLPELVEIATESLADPNKTTEESPAKD